LLDSRFIPIDEAATMRALIAVLLLSASAPLFANKVEITATEIDALLPQVIAWRRDFHQHPELGNQEIRTAGIVAAHLKSLGLSVKTGVAETGVVGILRGGKPGPKIALRADMDALPVTEDTGLAFASTVKSEYRGQPVGVMHACGHDAHTAILLGVATLMSQHREQIAGEVMFIFQPAEEGPPLPGQPFGAALMVQQGLFADFKPTAVFGLHVWAALPVGKVGYRSGPTMAAADEWTLRISGRQTHGSRPWDGVDPITVAAQIQLATQQIIARQIDIVRSPVVLTTGAISGGVRYNIIPDSVEMTGTIRTFDPEVRADVIRRFERTAKAIAEASGASASLQVNVTAPLTANSAALSELGGQSLRTSLGADAVVEMPLLTIAEDFSQFAPIAPTFYYFVGATAPSVDPRAAPMNHSPQFMLDEGSLRIGVQTLLALATDALK